MPLTAFKDLLGEKFESANKIAKDFKAQADKVPGLETKLEDEKKARQTAESERDTARTDLKNAKKDVPEQVAALTTERDTWKGKAETEATAHAETKRNYALEKFLPLKKADYLAAIPRDEIAKLAFDDKGRPKDPDVAQKLLDGWKADLPDLFRAEGDSGEDAAKETTGGGPEPGRRTGGGDGKSKEDRIREKARKDREAYGKRTPLALRAQHSEAAN